MSDLAPLRLVDEGEEPVVDAAEPKVFARSISVPPGAPWDQARAARLEARVGAPLPLGEVSYQLRRLDSWRPGQAAKFAAFYVRAKDVGQRLRAECLVDGRTMEVVFVSRVERERRARGVTLVAVVAALGTVLALASIAVAISARHSAEVQLAGLEKLSVVKSRMAKALEAEHRSASALDVAGMQNRSLSNYLLDLDWASSAKAPGARIQALHWDRGAMAVEARGDAAPLAGGDRELTKIGKPLKPGLWLWGVTSRGVAGGSRNPPPNYQSGSGQ